MGIAGGRSLNRLSPALNGPDAPSATTPAPRHGSVRRPAQVVCLWLVAACSVLPVGEPARGHPEPPAIPPEQEAPAASEAADLAPLLEPIRARFGVPGLAAAVLRGDRVVASGAAGVRRAGQNDAISLDDPFHLGSDTKAMTATLIAVLIEQGVLDWTTTVGEVFAADIPNMHQDWRTVTIEQLLRHRGGAPADLSAGGLWYRLWQRRGSPSEQRRELVRDVVTRPPAAVPGSTFIYSNAGYSLLGAIAERCTARTWEDLMHDRLFQPLGITTAGFGAPGSDGRPGVPWGHRPSGQPVEPGPQADNPPAIAPAGTVHMTLGDWARFVALHLRGHPDNPHRQPRLLAPETFDRLLTPGEGDRPAYAGGWVIERRPWARGEQSRQNGAGETRGGPDAAAPEPPAAHRPDPIGRVLMHAGSNTLWFCVAWLAPERDAAVLVACNRGGSAGERAADAAAATLVQRFVAPSPTDAEGDRRNR